MVGGDFSANLAGPEGAERDKEIAVALAAVALEDMPSHFRPLQHPWTRDGWTWSMFQLSIEVRSRMEYILGVDRCLFSSMSVQDPRHNSDHYLILG